MNKTCLCWELRYLLPTGICLIGCEFLTFTCWSALHGSPPCPSLPCSSQFVSFWLSPADQPSMAHLLALHCHALYRMWVSDFHLLISPPWLISLPSIAMVFTECEFLTFTCWSAFHGSPPCPPLPCSSQQVSFWLSPADQPSMAHLLALYCHALHRMWVSDFHLDKPSMANLLALHCHVLYSEWVSDFHLLISPPWLTSLPSIAMLFTGREFLTFTCWSALLGLPPCSPLQCSSQYVSFWLSPADQPSMAHLLALHCHAFTVGEFLTFTYWSAVHGSPSCPPLPCSSQRVSF